MGMIAWSYFLSCFAFGCAILALITSIIGSLRYRRHGFAILLPISLLLLAIMSQHMFYMTTSDMTIRLDTYGVGEQYIETTNPILLEGLKRIDFSLDHVPNTLFDDNTDVKGQYRSSTRSIILVVTDFNYDINGSYWFNDFSYFHELGHHIWHWHLTDEERELWKGIWKKDMYIENSGGFGYFPTKYSEESYGEDFAESFARLVFDSYDPENYFSVQYYRTQNIDPERKYILTLYLERIFGNSCLEDDPVICVRVEVDDGE